MKVTDKIFNFLGLEDMNFSVDSVGMNRHVNRTQTISASLYEDLADFYKDKNRKLSALSGLETDYYWN